MLLIRTNKTETKILTFVANGQDIIQYFLKDSPNICHTIQIYVVSKTELKTFDELNHESKEMSTFLMQMFFGFRRIFFAE